MMWYLSRLLRFECDPSCSKCCEVEKGEYGQVTFHHSDVKRLTEDQRKEVIWLGRANMKKPDYWEVPTTCNTPCNFLVDVPFGGGPKRCGIHNDKPNPCQAYPFWPTIMESERVWNKEAEFCPGIGDGDIVPIAEIRAKLDSVKDYPKLER